MNVGRHAFFLADDMLSSTLQSSFASTLINFGYWVLPKPADMGMLLYQAMGADSSFRAPLDMAQLDAAGFSILLSALTSLAFAAVVLFAATRKFQAVDY